MKYGTIARMAKWVITIAVIIVVLVPALMSFAATMSSDSGPIEVGSEAVFELDLMNESSLKENLDEARTSGGYVVFGSITWTFAEHTTREIAKAAMLNGVPELTVYDQDGNIVKIRQVLMQNSVLVGVYMDISSKGILDKVSSISMDYESVSDDGKVDLLWDCTSGVQDGRMHIDIRVPLVAYGAALAYGTDTKLSMSMEYAKLVKVDADTLVDVEDTVTCNVSRSSGVTTLILNGIGSDNGTGTIGNCSLINTGNSIVISAHGSVAEALREGMHDGILSLTIGDDSYEMDTAMAESFINIIGLLEVTA